MAIKIKQLQQLNFPSYVRLMAVCLEVNFIIFKTKDGKPGKASVPDTVGSIDVNVRKNSSCIDGATDVSLQHYIANSETCGEKSVQGNMQKTDTYKCMTGEMKLDKENTCNYSNCVQESEKNMSICKYLHVNTCIPIYTHALIYTQKYAIHTYINREKVNCTFCS